MMKVDALFETVSNRYKILFTYLSGFTSVFQMVRPEQYSYSFSTDKCDVFLSEKIHVQHIFQNFETEAVIILLLPL